MTPERAAEVLRGLRIRQSQGVRTACAMGADAIEFQAWLFGQSASFSPRIREVYSRWHCSDEDVDLEEYARAEWEKERKG